MQWVRTGGAAVAAALLLFGTGGCSGSADGNASTATSAAKVPVTIRTASGAHVFTVEVARTKEAQAQGLMYRTDIPEDGGMLFAPYPPEGGGPREANFWMKNTPTPLDILFIRPDGTIARIADNTIPFSEQPIPSGEPVGAVLELRGGRAADLGISEGDKASWPH